MQLPPNLKDRLQPLVLEKPLENSAAVAIILTKNPSLMLLVERKKREGDPWSGQMAFPGGHFEKADGSLLGTVLRETREEVGVDLEGSLLGRLSDVVPRNRLGLTVEPFISLWEKRPEVRLARTELENYYWIGLRELHDSYKLRRIPEINREMESYLCEGRIVWGLTARILRLFFEAIRA